MCVCVGGGGGGHDKKTTYKGVGHIKRYDIAVRGHGKLG